MPSKKSKTKPEAREARRTDEGLAGRVELERESGDLDTRLVSGRNYPIENIREKAMVKIALLPTNDKYAVKLYRGNVLVAQELVTRGDYTSSQVEGAFRGLISDGEYDKALTETYLERKALRGQDHK